MRDARAPDPEPGAIERSALEPVEPEGWVPGRGYSNGMLAPAGAEILFVAGQIGWDRDQKIVAGGFVDQFAQALANVVEVVRAAGGDANSIARLTIFVTDKAEYLEQVAEIGAAYRKVMGKHFPAMSLLEVRSLLEADALVEIEATAALAPRAKESRR